MENARQEKTERDILDASADVLRELLPSSWNVEVGPAGSGDALRMLDATIVLAPSNGSGRAFAVEVRRSLVPRDVTTMLSGLGRSVRALAGGVPLLVVAPWIGARAQALLAEEEINYIDLTGNVRIQLDYPAVFIVSTGASRDPSAQPRGRSRVRGPKAGRLIRTLADAKPPYGVRELAETTGLAQGYVSQMLQTLDREALIERSARGRVEAVDVVALLRRWAESYDVLRSNKAQTFIAPDGAADAYGALAGLPPGTRAAVTGSFAAVRLAAVAAPSQLFVYCDDPRMVAQTLRLLPADEGADVVLLTPFDQIVWAGCASRADGVQAVAPTQVAVDCLTGTGRMPAEGEAVLGWLTADDGWQRPLDRVALPGDGVA